MFDALDIVLLLVLFAVTSLYVRGCGSLKRGGA